MTANESPPDWIFSVQGTIANVVEQNYQSEAHRWPCLSQIEGKCYNYKGNYIIIEIKDQIGAGVPKFSGEIEIFSTQTHPMKSIWEMQNSGISILEKGLI